jgi:hypothetical protein
MLCIDALAVTFIPAVISHLLPGLSCFVSVGVRMVFSLHFHSLCSLGLVAWCFEESEFAGPEILASPVWQAGPDLVRERNVSGKGLFKNACMQ